jgi:hypothetical protein
MKEEPCRPRGTNRSEVSRFRPSYEAASDSFNINAATTRKQTADGGFFGTNLYAVPGQVDRADSNDCDGGERFAAGLGDLRRDCGTTGAGIGRNEITIAFSCAASRLRLMIA